MSYQIDLYNRSMDKTCVLCHNTKHVDSCAPEYVSARVVFVWYEAVTRVMDVK